MKYAPIIIFAFNRVDVIQVLVKTLQMNPESKDSDLYVFVDGARLEKEGELEKVKLVQNYVKGISGFKSLTYRFSATNKNLAPSIIEGVTEVIEKYGRCIVLEDDLILSTNFLAWMNQCLNKYKENEDVFQISGFTPSVLNKDEELGDVFFTPKAHSWGWATWKDRWNLVDWNMAYWDEFSKSKQMQKKFSSIGNEMPGLLFAHKAGKKSTWWARFCYSQFILGKYTAYPILSKVINEGFTGEATHCNVYNTFKVDFDKTDKRVFELPKDIKIDKKLQKRFFSYYTFWSRVKRQIKTKLMNAGFVKQYIVDIDI